MLKQKKLIAEMLTTVVIMGNMGILAHADIVELSADELINIPGLIQIKTGYGEDVDPSYILNK